MSEEQPKQYGVTPPIATDPPTKKELELTDDLLKTLGDFGLFESEQEAQKRFLLYIFAYKLVIQPYLFFILEWLF